MKPTTKCREYKEGRTGRRRTYKCRQCPSKFSLFLLSPLPASARYCQVCQNKYPHLKAKVNEEFERRNRNNGITVC